MRKNQLDRSITATSNPQQLNESKSACFQPAPQWEMTVSFVFPLYFGVSEPEISYEQLLNVGGRSYASIELIFSHSHPCWLLRGTLEAFLKS